MNNLELHKIDGDNFLKISDTELMSPFMMNVVSDSNHWIFVTSNGGITLGRRNPESALFPYVTDDKLIQSADYVGPKTIFQIYLYDSTLIWEPFLNLRNDDFEIQRNIYKSVLGNKIIFEEVNQSLQLCFRYHWNTSHRFGFIKKSELINYSKTDYRITVLDGLQGILPYGIGSDLERAVSNLGDAYKRAELLPASNLGVFALSAMIVDRAEPAEALKATIVWNHGIEPEHILLSNKQLRSFRNGASVLTEMDIKGEKGSYFVVSTFDILNAETTSWKIVANLNQTHNNIAELTNLLEGDFDMDSAIQADIDHGTQKLRTYLFSADGFKVSEDLLADHRHTSNVLFNIMRGGIFHDNYLISRKDFSEYIRNANTEVYENHKAFLIELPKKLSRKQLLEKVKSFKDVDLERLAIEYLPLKFSRRHGDPSRPWNYFNINTLNERTGEEILDYEGNWRDLFQNWEALAYSYPEFIEAMIFKFLNSTTFDGYNPYRITKDGFDWEVINPDDPWSYIGYWGDHQIIYLLKFLEFANRTYPQLLKPNFTKNIFVYASVPYKIKSYEDILHNPQDTISFDAELDSILRKRKLELGTDATLIRLDSSTNYHVNLIEKLMATVLAKISNFIPDAGIWMNTQRPEWNDANNALVGNGASMVTLCYLRRFLNQFKDFFDDFHIERISFSNELKDYYHSIRESLTEFSPFLTTGFDTQSRKAFLDSVGKHASDYRQQIYQKGFWGKKSSVSVTGLQSFISLSISYLEASIKTNLRSDGLYHTYNLVTLTNNEILISRLDEMLEGQVAVLSSGFLSSEDALKVLDALKNSRLYRPDQQSYILYPNKDLPGFMVKNMIPKERVESCKYFVKLLEDNNKDIILKDINGNYHFNGEFRNAADLKKALSDESLRKYELELSSDLEEVVNIWEEVFHHKAFTGRSGTFFAYEGLGSIYWHMVSKLLLATQECCIKALNEETQESVKEGLAQHYHDIKEGLGVHKTPREYGAFPTDPYSHTPFHKGVQQPGMTGQVKEDILSHFGEMGVEISHGMLCFKPTLLKPDSFLSTPQDFEFYNVEGGLQILPLNADSQCFTLCQVPVIYRKSNSSGMIVVFENGDVHQQKSNCLSRELTSKIFSRTSEVHHIEVFLPSVNALKYS